MSMQNLDHPSTAVQQVNNGAISLPVFQVVETSPQQGVPAPVRPKLKKKPPRMDETTVAQIHSTPVQVHRSRRKSKSQSRHDRHRCHKSRNRSRDSDKMEDNQDKLTKEINKLKKENYQLNKKLNLSLTSLDSGLAQSQSEGLPPFDMDVGNAYQHIKTENERLVKELSMLQTEYREMSNYVERMYKENSGLEEDATLLKNLVYKLNMELERYQKLDSAEANTKWDILPDNYHKNFLRPVLPLLKAYSQTIREKNELIGDMERDFKRFHLSFHEVVKENEKLYNELEKKAVKNDGSFVEDLRRAKKELESTRQEVEVLARQVALGKEKMDEVHAVYRSKVTEMWKQKQTSADSLEESKAELYTLQGKYSILKQEFERVKMDSETRLPLAVHAASITECKRLFFDLKNEYEVEKRNLLLKIKEMEGSRAHKTPHTPSKSTKGYPEIRTENEDLKQRLQDMESRGIRESELQEARRQLRISNTRADELSSKLAKTKKQLHKAMAFAEDIVREQEGLLLQLHTKQKENHVITSQFGIFRKEIKNVEKGANEELNSIEQTIKHLEADNSRLTLEVKKLKESLKQKEELIDELQPTRDSTS